MVRIACINAWATLVAPPEFGWRPSVKSAATSHPARAEKKRREPPVTIHGPARTSLRTPSAETRAGQPSSERKMSNHENLETVKRLYAAFGAGDVQTLLGMLDTGVDWSVP